MGLTREGRELSRLTIEEFHGQICPIETQPVVQCCFRFRIPTADAMWLRWKACQTQQLENREDLAATFITAPCTPASFIYEGIVFGQYRTVSRERHLRFSRVRQLVVVDYEPWSPAAWFIGGVSHFATEVPVDCTYLGYPWHSRELGACTTLWSVFRCRI
jgi:hypothetical protein